MFENDPAYQEMKFNLACPCGCGKNLTKDSFLDFLFFAQSSYGKPFKISSGFRCPAYNSMLSSPETSVTLLGLSAGINYLTPSEAFLILRALLLVGFERFTITPTEIYVDQDPNAVYPFLAILPGGLK